MYGTRSAAQDWQAEVKKRMLELGFEQGRSNAGVYYNKARGIACLVHGDDFVCVGDYQQLIWFKLQLGSQCNPKEEQIWGTQDRQLTSSLYSC